MEKSQTNTKSNSRVVEPDVKTDSGRESRREISGSMILEAEQGKKEVNTITKPELEAIKPKSSSAPLTNQQFLESKLHNFKNFVSSIETLKNTALSNALSTLTPKDVLEWVIWIKNEKKSIDMAISELFQMHNLKTEILKPEEIHRIKLYFTCFHSIAFPSDLISSK